MAGEKETEKEKEAEIDGALASLEPTGLAAIEIVSDSRAGEGGFFALRRLRLRNRRSDGSVSREYTCDFLLRPLGLDAVGVAIFARDDVGSVRVLLRAGLRPAIYYGRSAGEVPIADRTRSLFLTEIVAGVIEPGERGEEGVRRRAAEEVHEETGFVVQPESVRLLGPAVFLSPGALPEKLYLTAVELPGSALAVTPTAPGDGSPMEEHARSIWLSLDDALAACASGALCDLKTELALRRLAEWLSRPAGPSP